MLFSLKWMLIAVAFIAVSLVALLNANDLWIMVSRNLARLSVFIAIVGAVWSVGKQRAFWGGYALFIVGYINSGFGFLWVTESLTDRAFSYIHPQIASPVTETFYPPFDSIFLDRSISRENNPDGSVIVTYIKPTEKHLSMVGGAVLAILIGFVGGLIATTFYRRRLTQIVEPARPSSSPNVSEQPH